LREGWGQGARWEKRARRLWRAGVSKEKDGEQENDPTESQFHPAYSIQAKFQLGEYIRNHPSPASEPHSRHQITPGIETGESLRHKIEIKRKLEKYGMG